MVRIAAVIVTASSALLAGCGSTSLVRPQAPPDKTVARAATGYLAALGASQSRLAAAERAIARRPRTPAALARAIGQLQAAVGRLGADLAAIRPPASVASLHARLVGIVRLYAARLGHAARVAGRPEDELRAVSLLTSATEQATRGFPATVEQIDHMLAR